MLLAHFIAENQHFWTFWVLDIFEKNCIPPKILHNINMRSHKKFCAKKMIFRGAFGLFYQKYQKNQSGQGNQKANLGKKRAETGQQLGKC